MDGRHTARRTLPALLVAMLLIGGCAGDRARGHRQLRQPEVMPTYAELVTRYNANIDGLSSLHSPAKVRLRWRDDRRWRSANLDDSTVAAVPPTRVMVSLGKLGQQVAWLGSNEQRYWLFDLESEDKPVYVGRHATADRVDPDQLPLPVRAMELLQLLGITPFDPEVTPEPPVGWYEGYFVINPPGTSLRLFLDPATAAPARIDILDGRGGERAVARLSRRREVEVSQGGRTALVATSLDVELPHRDAYAVITLENPSLGRERIQERWFDFDRMSRALRPRAVHDLDEDR